MTIEITCQCGKTYTVGDETAGKTAKCQACGASIAIPAPGADASPPRADLGDDDIAAVDRLTEAYKILRKEMAKAIVGQEQVLEELLMCIFARGHAILEGVPG
ncbi:hypothetical protein LCGC14_1877180, partial [marine sediment metagenome]